MMETIGVDPGASSMLMVIVVIKAVFWYLLIGIVYSEKRYQAAMSSNVKYSTTELVLLSTLSASAWPVIAVVYLIKKSLHRTKKKA